MRLLHFALTLGVALLSCGQLQAAFLFNTITSATFPDDSALGIQNPPQNALEYGTVFQVASSTNPSPLSVSALGFYDYNGDGLQESHYVQLFQLLPTLDGNGNPQYELIAETTVDAGTTDTLINGFRYAPISLPSTPVTLTAGNTYLLLASVGTIVGDYPEDRFAQLTEDVNNTTYPGLLDGNFVPGQDSTKTGIGTAKSLINTSPYDAIINPMGFQIGDLLHVPTSGIPNNNTTTIVQPGENFPFLVNLEYGAVPEPNSILIWSILGALGFVCAFKRKVFAV